MAKDHRPSAVFVTSHTFGEAALRGLLDAGDIRVSQLVVLDERFAAKTVGFTQCESCKDEVGQVIITDDGTLVSLRPILEAAAPQYLFIVGWSYIVHKDIIDIPASVTIADSRHGPHHGAIGMHPTALPVGRGRAPIPWTILNGVSDTALTAFNLEDEVDSGSIIGRDDIAIPIGATTAWLFREMEDAHYRLGKKIGLQVGSKNGLSAHPQDGTRATYYPKRTRESGKISSQMREGDVHALVRAQSGPYPRAFLLLPSGKQAEVVASRPSACHETTPVDGEILSIAGRWISLKCSDGIIDLRLDRYLSGSELGVGDVL